MGTSPVIPPGFQVESTPALPEGFQVESAPAEEPGPFHRFFTGVAQRLPHPIDAVREWWNKPDEYAKAADAMHTLTQIHNRAAAMPENKGKPMEKWKQPPVSPEEQAVIDKGMQANLGTAEDTTGIMGPAIGAAGEAKKGNLAGAAGQMVGAYGVPAAVGAGVEALPEGTGTALKAGAKAAAPDVAQGTLKAGAGYGAMQIPGVNPIAEALAGGPIIKAGIEQAGKGVVKGYKALKQSLADTKKTAAGPPMAAPVSAMPAAAAPAAVTSTGPEPIPTYTPTPVPAVPIEPQTTAAAGPVLPSLPATQGPTAPPGTPGAVELSEADNRAAASAATPAPVGSPAPIAAAPIGQPVPASSPAEPAAAVPRGTPQPVANQPQVSNTNMEPEHPAADYFRRGIPAPMAAYAKDVKVADFLKNKGVNSDIWNKVTDAQRDQWVRDATGKKTSQNPDRIGDVAKMLDKDPPTNPLSDETEADILKFHLNQAGLGLQTGTGGAGVKLRNPKAGLGLQTSTPAMPLNAGSEPPASARMSDVKPDAPIAHEEVISDISSLSDPQEYNNYGLRVHHGLIGKAEKAPLKIGSTPINSYEWDRDSPTSRRLNGVSAVGLGDLSDTSITNALKQLHYYGDEGDQVVVLGSDKQTFGDDHNEVVLQQPKVLKTYRLGKPERSATGSNWRDNPPAKLHTDTPSAGVKLRNPKAERAAK